MSHSHKVMRCKHGTVVAQCRCPGPKGVEIVVCPPECLLGGTPVKMGGVDPALTPEFNRLQHQWAGITGDECPCEDCRLGD
jgi:hypothetical protein